MIPLPRYIYIYTLYSTSSWRTNPSSPPRQPTVGNKRKATHHYWRRYLPPSFCLDSSSSTAEGIIVTVHVFAPPTVGVLAAAAVSIFPPFFCRQLVAVVTVLIYQPSHNVVRHVRTSSEPTKAWVGHDPASIVLLNATTTRRRILRIAVPVAVVTWAPAWWGKQIAAIPATR